ncbi:hypothetical protein CTEN210_07563 [Chaetoceros tenuissimus]|uniref:ubiquitinyl hydrolase 1 n=1 Tax=Chaetoceros tenuissimus TaxID=426638 RepID=A0AAD3CRX9_9STRA|nr:hypothetical protein CTEN210_07563 [Chaetoceros tenuissimus]
MTSRLVNVANRGVNASIPKNKQKDDHTLGQSGSRENVISIYNKSHGNQHVRFPLPGLRDLGVGPGMALDLDFVYMFLRKYGDSSITRTISLTTTLSSVLDVGIGTEKQVPALENLDMKKEATALSTQIAGDLLSLSLRTNLPYKLIQREYIRYKRRLRLQATHESLRNYKKLINYLKGNHLYNPPEIEKGFCFTGKVNGLPNYSSTCFFNAVMQALASSTAFVRYLERLSYLEDCLKNIHKPASRIDIGIQNTSALFAKKEPLSKLLLCILNYVNMNERHIQRNEIHPKIRQILDRVASENDQFKSYKHHSSKEQQDAHEFLQALVALLVDELNLEGHVSSQDADDEVDTEDSFFIFDSKEIQQCDCQNSEKSSESISDNDSKESNKEEKKDELENEEKNMIDPSSLPSCTKLMIQSLNESMPSPLNGRIGSQLQCCNCGNVKPIHDSSFLEIPVVPLAISNPNTSIPSKSCNLIDCLDKFAEIENVEGVNCRSCSIKLEIDPLLEECLMMEDAIRSLASSNKETITIENEVQRLKDRIEFLRSIDPDSEKLDENEDDEHDYINPNESIPKPVKSDHKKRLIITSIPSVLCLHVKRLHYDVNYNMVKCNQQIMFPEQLDLNKIVAFQHEKEKLNSPSNFYRLISVISHLGGPFCGHYITYRISPHDWTYTSDENIKLTNWKEVSASNAYMLIYEKA